MTPTQDPAPGARLFTRTGPAAGTEASFAEELVIGRNQDCDLRIKAKFVSGRHARIFFDAATSTYFAEDLGSKNGLAVDGVRVRQPMRLDNLSVVTVAGKIDFVFQITPGAAPAATDTAVTRLGSALVVPEIGSDEA